MSDHSDSQRTIKSDADQLDLKGAGGRVTATVLTGDEKKRALDIVAALKARNAKTAKHHD